MANFFPTCSPVCLIQGVFFVFFFVTVFAKMRTKTRSYYKEMARISRITDNHNKRKSNFSLKKLVIMYL